MLLTYPSDSAQNHGKVNLNYTYMYCYPDRLKNPAFGPAHIRELTEIVFESAIHACVQRFQTRAICTYAQRTVAGCLGGRHFEAG
jgi:hypothetical protein